MVSAGRILIMPKGDWNNITTYDMLDLVSYNGVAYLARASSTGQNPSTDTQMTYWQPFGSASAIATTTTPGLVMPDDESIKIDAYGKINVNIDNSTLVYDTTNHYLKAVISNALADLTDTNITSAQAGQVLAYNSVSQKWENTTLYGDGIALSSLDATTITSAIGALQAPTFTEAVTRANVASGDTTPTLWGKVKKWFNDVVVKTDLTNILASGATNTTESTINAGTYFYLDGVLVRAKADIATNATFTLNTNYEVVTAGALNDRGYVSTSPATGFTVITKNDKTQIINVFANFSNKSAGETLAYGLGAGTLAYLQPCYGKDNWLTATAAGTITIQKATGAGDGVFRGQMIRFLS